MKGRLFYIVILMWGAIAFVSSLLYFQSSKSEVRESKDRQIIDVNELEQLGRRGDIEKLEEKSAALQESLRDTEEDAAGDVNYLIIGGMGLLCLMVLFLYLHFAILRPFERMKAFAGEIARGNFDVSLRYGRSNYFGDFTWAFDSMRQEISKARACEKEAIENNKTVIATLSHDIKTPIASIRAYAEGLEANMDCSMERREKYLSVIMRKCDEVARLTNDLFLHSISDLDKLKIDRKRIGLGNFLERAVSEIAAERDDVRLVLPQEEVYVLADENRLLQVCENIINNARKYAKTTVDVSLEAREEGACITFQDYGRGMLDEDIPFIFGKFYRGKNCGEEQGSGLGLYIVKHIVGRMKGDVMIQNNTHGLAVMITLPSLRTF